MTCYRFDCEEQCDEFKELSCIFKIDKSQYEYMKKIEDTYTDVCVCRNRLISARLIPSKTNVKICTKCGAIRRD